jgi:type III secretory pathway lipoprotein EscJ
LSEDEVRRLVARGVEALQPDNVAVVFKRVDLAPQPPRDVGWYLSDAYVVAGSLTLMMLASLGSLVLAFRSRRQTATIDSLRNELQAAAQRPESSAQAVAPRPELSAHGAAQG